MDLPNSQHTTSAPRFFFDARPNGYSLPADSEEGARLNSQHRDITQLLDGKRILAPVSLGPGDEVLDCATGTGIWMLDVASQHPQVRFTGIDISPHLFPSAANTPPNVSFEQQSLLALPPSYAARFSLVHQRLLIGGLRAAEWPAALKEHFRVLKPGGWVQLCEIRPKGKTSIGPASARMVEMNTAKLLSRGMEPDCGLRLGEWAEAAGFVNVQTVCKQMPLGKGQPYGKTMAQTYIGLKTSMLQSHPEVTEEAYDRWLQEMRDEWNVVDKDATVPFHFMWAQKPVDAA